MECSVVCKEWSLPALQMYFNKLILTGRNANHLIPILEQDYYFQHCHWVQTLRLSHKKEAEVFYERSSEEEENLTKEQLLKFLTYLPNLRKLRLDTRDGIDYVEYLLDSNADAYLTRLEEISIEDSPFNFNTPYDLRCDIYYKFRTSLSQLTVFQEQESNIVTQYDGIINYLNQFKRLAHLKYYNHSKQVVMVYQLQAACPNLTTLKLMTKEDLLTYQEGGCAFLNTSNLQNLELSLPRMSSSYADMLILHLPTKLNRLYVKLENIDLYDWIHLISLERVLKLAERMGKLSSAEIRCEPYYRDYKSKSVHKESHMTLFFQVLNAFMGNKKVFCTAEFSDFRSNDKTMSYSNGVLNVIYGLTHQDIYGHNQNRARFDFELVVPDKTVSVIGPEIFNQLNFNVCTADDQLAAYKILKYILTNCHYLQYVEFVAINDYCLEFNLSSHINRLSYYSCKKIKPSTKTEDNLKVIKFVNFIPSGDFMNVLAAYLPNAYYFRCDTRDRSDHDEEAPPLLIDLSDFKKLETINLNMEFYLTEFYNSFKLKINYINGQELIEFKKAGSTSSDTNQEISSVPTLTINCKKVMELIQLKIPEGEIIEIIDGILQEPRSPNFNDKSAYLD